MSPAQWLGALGIWFVMLLLAVANGALRDFLTLRLIGEPAAHVLHTLLLSAAFLGLIVLWLRSQGPLPDRTLLAVGSLWLVLALAFEFGFFGLVRGVPWSRLLADYDILRGRILALLWLVTWFGPLIAGRLLWPR